MDFLRFMYLLDKRALFFPSALLLSDLDPFEGSLPVQNVSSRREVLSQIPTEAANSALAEWAVHGRNVRGHMYISCWYANEVESAAMWAQYAALDRGISIKTTFKDSSIASGQTQMNRFT